MIIQSQLENWLPHRFIYSFLLLPHLKSVLRWAMC